MGWRFRKSFKIAPGVKFNLNKNSHSFTFGGKGTHYTINSKGKRTKTVGVPGTGLSYTETSSKKSDRKKGTETKMSGDSSEGKSIGCLGWIVILILLCLAIYLYAFCWIPAIVVLIYSLFSKFSVIWFLNPRVFHIIKGFQPASLGVLSRKKIPFYVRL